MEVVTGAMSTLLPKLGNLLKEEYELQKGVRGEIMFLKAELESMQAALLKVSEAPIDQPPDIQVKLWARDVKELSYDVEDTIDAFMVRVGARAPKKLHGLRGFINRSLNLLTMANVHHKIGTDIKDIKSRITEVSERRDRYKVDIVVAKPVGPTIDSLRLSALYKKATELVGTGEKSVGLIKRLMEGDEASQQLKIVSIVGFGGLGKTTLANVVYEKLKVQFDCGAFISVSLNPNMEKIFKNMLHQLGKHSNIDDEAQLINELREFLRNRSQQSAGWFGSWKRALGRDQKVLAKILKSTSLSGPKGSSTWRNAPSKSRVPLWLFLFPAKKKKPSLFACVNPALQKQQSDMAFFPKME